MLLSSAAAVVVAAGVARGQGLVGIGKQVKPESTREPADILARARVEFGLSDAEDIRAETLAIAHERIGDVLVDGITSTDGAAKELLVRTRKTVGDLLATQRYKRSELVDMKLIMLDTEKDIQRIIGRLTSSEISASEARQAVRIAFAEFVARLETLAVTG